MAMGSKTASRDNMNNMLANLKTLTTFTPLYMEDIDTLVFQPKKPVPAISVECGDLMVRINPKTNAIAGLEIEDWEEYFIIKHPEFAPIWKDMRKAILKKKCENEDITAFLSIVQELLAEIITKQDCTSPLLAAV